MVAIPNAFACSTHGSPDIGIPELTPLGGDMWELRFNDFITFAYTPGEMCSCGLQVLNGWDIQSARIVLAGTNTQVATFPTFYPNSVLSTVLESSFPTSSDSKWIGLKNTISVSSSGGQDVDLVFTGNFPGATEAEILQEIEGKLLSAGKVNDQGTDFVADHFHVFTVIQEIIGGKMIPIDTTSLLLVGAQNITWLIPLMLSAAGIGLVLVRRK
ncbi:MAG: hypothetical protein ACRENO_03320 [Thermodesulfobacteriota bacterium]